jgi:dienelactone hydrolase
VVVVVAVAWKPSRVAFQTLFLVPSLLDAGPQPLDLAPAPNRISVPYTDVDGITRDGDLWLPASASAEDPVALMVVVYGINPLGLEHPALTRIPDTVARLGVALYIPDLPSLDEERLDPAEVGNIVAATTTAMGQAEIDPDRVGLIGISAGGSIALLAAADPALTDQLDWVAAFGAPSEITVLIENVVAHAYRDGEQIVDWSPSRLSRQVIFEMLVSLVPDPADRDGLEQAYRDDFLASEEPIGPCSCAPVFRTPEGAGVEALLTAGSLPNAEALMAVAPAAVLDLAASLSPLTHAGEIGSRVFLMHDRGDHHVPVAQSRAMAAALENAGAEVRYSEFRLFDHVTPDTTDLLGAAPEIWKLFWYLHAVLMETL